MFFKILVKVIVITFLISSAVFAETELEKDIELAKIGNAGAEFRVGARYLNGEDGFKVDYEKAIFWLKKAAAQNHGNALFNLGYMYVYGEGVEVNFKFALDYFERSKNAGFAPASYMLCIMYYDGAGVPKDKHKAYELCKKSADLGYAPAKRIIDEDNKTINPNLNK